MYTEIYVETDLPDLQATPGVNGGKVAEYKPGRRRLVLVTDGIIFLRFDKRQNMIEKGYAIGAWSAQAGGFVLYGSGTLYAARYGAATLRVLEEFDY